MTHTHTHTCASRALASSAATRSGVATASASPWSTSAAHPHLVNSLVCGACRVWGHPHINPRICSSCMCMCMYMCMAAATLDTQPFQPPPDELLHLKGLEGLGVLDQPLLLLPDVVSLVKQSPHIACKQYMHPRRPAHTPPPPVPVHTHQRARMRCRRASRLATSPA